MNRNIPNVPNGNPSSQSISRLGSGMIPNTNFGFGTSSNSIGNTGRSGIPQPVPTGFSQSVNPNSTRFFGNSLQSRPANQLVNQPVFSQYMNQVNQRIIRTENDIKSVQQQVPRREIVHTWVSVSP